MRASLGAGLGATGILGVLIVLFAGIAPAAPRGGEACRAAAAAKEIDVPQAIFFAVLEGCYREALAARRDR